MTWLDLKNQIRDLGFEDSGTIQEYNTIVINSSNRAINLIKETILETYRDYFKELLSNELMEWELPTLIPITTETKDDFIINLPGKVLDLVPLLASYFVWLDDDQVKATVYWNTYQDFEQKLIQCITVPTKISFTGGLEF